jgi:circadian clock protein KaiC
VLGGDLEGVFSGILDEVERREPALVVVDSFRSVVRMIEGDRRIDPRSFQDFVQRLSNQMTRWEATSFLLGEFVSEESATNPIFTVADGVLWLRHLRYRDARVRKLEVGKMRGMSELPGQHIYRIRSAGIRVYPRTVAPLPETHPVPSRERLSTGVQGLDRITGGGIPTGDRVMVTGPAGSGKSLVGMHFAAAGIQAGERVVAAIFEESVDRYRLRADALGLGFTSALERGDLHIHRWQPLDLSVDETFDEIRDAIAKAGATRLVMDSLSGIEVAAEDGDEALQVKKAFSRLLEALARGKVTVLTTAEMHQANSSLRFAPHDCSFLADDMILHRYVEVQGALEVVVAVVKMRRSGHSREFHLCRLTPRGLVVGEPPAHLDGILTGVPRIVEERRTSSGTGSRGGGS